MAIGFHLREHSIRRTKIIEVLLDGVVVGAIYPMEKGIKVVSAHFSDEKIPEDFEGKIIEDDGSTSWPPIPSFEVSFNPRKYMIVGNKLVYVD